MKTLACLLLLTAAITAADVNFTGKWSGTATMTAGGDSREGTALLVLKQDGTTLTGTAGPDEQRSQPIQNGKVDGTRITFEIQTADKPVAFTLTLENDHLKGTGAGSPNGQEIKVQLDLTKASS